MGMDLTLLCQCGAPATGVWELIYPEGTAARIDVCQACGERLVGEMNEMHAAINDLQRQGLDERMARRVVDQRIERRELCPTVPWPECTCDG